MTDISNILIESARRVESGERFALVTIVRAEGSTPRKAGTRMLVAPDGTIFGTVGGAAVERHAIEHALKALQTGQTEQLELDLNDAEHMQTGMVCGGRMELLIEPFGIGPRLFLFGAGHVAQPTARLSREIGFEVIIHDSRNEWANRERFPNCRLVIGDLGELAEKLDSKPDDFLAVMTWCHDEDYRVLERILRKKFFYLGVIGSKRKAVEIKKRLSQGGFAKSEIARMTCPIGLDIGSHTPAEIAVAVAAQLVAIRHEWEKKRIKD